MAQPVRAARARQRETLQQTQRAVTRLDYSRLKSGSFWMSSGRRMRTTMLYQAMVS